MTDLDQIERAINVACHESQIDDEYGDALIERARADAQALWAYRVIEKATLVAGSYSPGYLPRHEALLLEKAKALVASDPSLEPETPR